MVATSDKPYPKLVALPNDAAERVLALDCARLLAPAGPIPLTGALSNIAHHRFTDLTAALLTQIDATVIVMPLFSADHDALSMIEALQALGFTGRILVIAPALPRPALVERELRAAGPGTRLTLVTP